MLASRGFLPKGNGNNSNSGVLDLLQKLRVVQVGQVTLTFIIGTPVFSICHKDHDSSSGGCSLAESLETKIVSISFTRFTFLFAYNS
jgi:hypothetical protein